MKVLLIGPWPDRGDGLAAALSPDVGLLYAPDGFYALTMIERERPDLVLLNRRMTGMSAVEVAGIIHNDPVHQGVRLGLLATGTDRAGDGEEIEVDLELDAALPPAELACEIRGVTAARPGRGGGSPFPARGGQPIQTLSGSLSVLGLSDLVQALSEARSAGCLTLEWGADVARIYLADGRVLDATWGECRGEEAFLEILGRGGRDRDALFRFEAMPWHELFAMPRTINRTVRELLLTTAIAIDESGRWRQGA